jgi:hypothetical protein
MKVMKKKQQPPKSLTSGRYSPHATLAAIGLKINSMKLLKPIKQNVVILQKSIRHMPMEERM